MPEQQEGPEPTSASTLGNLRRELDTNSPICAHAWPVCTGPETVSVAVGWISPSSIDENRRVVVTRNDCDCACTVAATVTSADKIWNVLILARATPMIRCKSATSQSAKVLFLLPVFSGLLFTLSTGVPFSTQKHCDNTQIRHRRQTPASKKERLKNSFQRLCRARVLNIIPHRCLKARLHALPTGYRCPSAWQRFVYVGRAPQAWKS